MSCPITYGMHIDENGNKYDFKYSDGYFIVTTNRINVVSEDFEHAIEQAKKLNRK